MAEKKTAKIIDAKSVSFNETTRVRIIEDRHAKLIPLVGDQVIAMWEEDSVFYRANITEHLDDGRYRIDCLHGYGMGIAKAEDIYLEIADIPAGSYIDEYLQKEVNGIENMRKQVRESLAKMMLQEEHEADLEHRADADHDGEPVDEVEGGNASPRETMRGEGAKHESKELRNAPP